MYCFNFYFIPGSLYVWRVGKVIKGFMKKATVVKTVIYLNPEPSACNSKRGVCQLDIFFDQLTFINNNGEKIIFTGTGTDSFDPCLKNIN
jgi:hypothetical protein